MLCKQRADILLRQGSDQRLPRGDQLVEQRFLALAQGHHLLLNGIVGHQADDLHLAGLADAVGPVGGLILAAGQQAECAPYLALATVRH